MTSASDFQVTGVDPLSASNGSKRTTVTKPRKVVGTMPKSSVALDVINRKVAELEGQVSALRDETRRLRQQTELSSTSGHSSWGTPDLSTVTKEVALAMQVELEAAFDTAMQKTLERVADLANGRTVLQSVSAPAPPSAHSGVRWLSPVSEPTLVVPGLSHARDELYADPSGSGRSPASPVSRQRPPAHAPVRRSPVGIDAVLPIIAVVIVLMVVLAWVG